MWHKLLFKFDGSSTSQLRSPTQTITQDWPKIFKSSANARSLSQETNISKSNVWTEVLTLIVLSEADRQLRIKSHTNLFLHKHSKIILFTLVIFLRANSKILLSRLNAWTSEPTHLFSNFSKWEGSQAGTRFHVGNQIPCGARRHPGSKTDRLPNLGRRTRWVGAMAVTWAANLPAIYFHVNNGGNPIPVGFPPLYQMHEC